MNPPVSFTTTRRVLFRDTDAAGIAHFSMFLFWMEDVEHEFLRERGLSVMPTADKSQTAQVGWPRVSVSCDYFRPVRFEDLVEIRLAIEKIGRKSLTYVFHFYSQGKEVASGKVVAACCTLGPQGQPQAVAIPADFLRAISSGAPDAWPT